MHSMTNQQRLFLVESSQLLEAWRHAYFLLKNYRGGMRWIASGGSEYLVRLVDNKGNGKSLGLRSIETERVFSEFVAGKEDAKARYKSLSEKLKLQSKLNKAVGISRVPNAVADVLIALEDAAMTSDFLVVGTHALFAYEAMSGVFFKQELLASGDIDLLFDARKKVSLIAKKMNGEGLLGLLKKADKSFMPIKSGGFRAVNSSGFMVDLITPARDMRYLDKITFSDNDLVASEVPGLQWLCNSTPVNTVVIAESGRPVTMNVPDPRAFCMHKAWLSCQLNRDPIKKPRDLSQSIVLLENIQNNMPMYRMDENYLKYLPRTLSAQFARVSQSDVTIDIPSLDQDENMGETPVKGKT